ncbi:MAG: aminopeptidase N [Pseudomonadota bacterium]|nr:aminopeptidase N [Pseudomonadota bacterium]
MTSDQNIVRLEDYQPYSFELESTDLTFDIRADHTDVESTTSFRRKNDEQNALELDGIDLELLSIAIDNRPLTSNEYSVDSTKLSIVDLPERFKLTIQTRIYPQANTALEGLYRSGDLYCTQCEAEGFRKITYYPDRPDVQSKFTTTLVADSGQFGVMLANGNLIRDEITSDNRRRVTWVDPFNKPSYLFALVAGNLAVLEDNFTTLSGRNVALRIYSEPHNIDACTHAMESLKRAMAWDESAFGREYDLDTFMIVAVEDFNMGAMENKGLNIFNTSCVLASPSTATDAAYLRVEGVVAHEYFHNWSGNRVTCRDWFQLSLKEGFTVFRDSEFSAAMNSRNVKRIQDVDALRTAQFAEDASPLAHPVRPTSYIEISNFYTTTIYEKGAEVVRMLSTMLGQDNFRSATDLYFDRHDGGAATTEDFVVAMEDVSGLNLDRFRNWYSQAGTPVIEVEESRINDLITLHLKQSCPPSPNQPSKSTFHIPISIGLISIDGQDALGQAGAANGFDIHVHTDLNFENPNADGTLAFHFDCEETTITISGVPPKSVVSFLRGFSAPVNVTFPRSNSDLLHLATLDTDGFVRWDAAQKILGSTITTPASDTQFAKALLQKLSRSAVSAADDGETKALLASAMTLPSTLYVLDQNPGRDVIELDGGRDRLLSEMGIALEDSWEEIVNHNISDSPYHADGISIARRSLSHLAMDYLGAGLEKRGPGTAWDLYYDLYRRCDNLTDRLFAFSRLLRLEASLAEKKSVVIQDFHDRFNASALVTDKWFSVQAGCKVSGTLPRIVELATHPEFDLQNPNRARALLSTFATVNHREFHRSDGKSYTFLADQILKLDSLNPQLASRVCIPLTRWQRFDSGRQERMKDSLERIQRDCQSKDLREVTQKSLMA